MDRKLSPVVLTGWSRLVVDPGAPIAPATWVGPPARLARMDRLCGLALVAADGALGTAALSPADAALWDPDRTAIVVGTAYGCHATNEEYYRGVVTGGPANASPRAFAYTLPSSPAGEISIHHGVRGPSETMATGLTSGLEALALGASLVGGGRATRAIVVAVDVATPLLAKLLRSSVPSLADAAAGFVLERADDAATRGATPRARIFATASRGGPSSRALTGAVESALADADLDGSAVRTIVATPSDAFAVRPLASSAGTRSAPVAALAAAAPAALAEWLALDDEARETPALVVAGDPDGGATAIVLG
jgi:hypothetical protein